MFHAKQERSRGRKMKEYASIGDEIRSAFKSWFTSVKSGATFDNHIRDIIVRQVTSDKANGLPPLGAANYDGLRDKVNAFIDVKILDTFKKKVTELIPARIEVGGHKETNPAYNRLQALRRICLQGASIASGKGYEKPVKVRDNTPPDFGETTDDVIARALENDYVNRFGGNRDGAIRAAKILGDALALLNQDIADGVFDNAKTMTTDEAMENNIAA